METGVKPFKLSGLVLCFILSIAAVLMLQAARVPGQALDEGYAIYLKEAFNLAHNRPLQDMGVNYYIDPTNPIQAPLTYPILFPAILAAPVAAMGYDVEFFKNFQMAIVLIALFAFCYAMRRLGFSLLEVSASIIVFGLSNIVRGDVNSIGSDFAFLPFLIIALVVIDKSSQAPPEAALRWGLAMGVAIFLATEIRMVGIALLPTAVALDLVRHRSVFRIGLISGIAAFSLLWAAETAWLGSTAYSPTIFTDYHVLTSIFGNLQAYRWDLEKEASGLPFEIGAILAILGFIALAGVGAVVSGLRGNVAGIFLVGYVGLLLVEPEVNATPRYLVPLLLFLGAFAVRGASVIARALSKSEPFAMGSAVAVALLGILLFSPDITRPVAPLGTAIPSVQEAFAFIKANVPADSLVAVTKSRSFHLFTDRRTIAPYRKSNVQETSDWLRQNKVDYLVVKYTPISAGLNFSDCPDSPLCQIDQAGAVEQIWQNQDFRVLKTKFASAAPAEAGNARAQ